MKKAAWVLIALVFSVSAVQAAPALDWNQVDFTYLLGGGISYNASRDNVVQSGTAFHNAVTAAGNPVSFQKIGGDGINNPVTGNFAMFGAFQYSDTNNVLDWVMNNANTQLAFEFRAWGVKLDFNNDGEADYTEDFTLDAKDMPGVDYLNATFAEIAEWGCTEMAPGVWVDIALGENNVAALSIVIENYVGKWGSIDAYLLEGDLIGPYPEGGRWTPGSGVRVAVIPVPVPGAILLAGIGTSLVGWLRRRRAL